MSCKPSYSPSPFSRPDFCWLETWTRPTCTNSCCAGSRPVGSFQLRRGLCALAPLYQKVNPHPFLVANRLTPGSYISLQSALAHYGLIPEYVPVVTSVGSGRPQQWKTPLGTFILRHIKPDLFFGYERIQVAPSQPAFIAVPEKALLDLLYLEPNSAKPEYIHELRLQNMESLDLGRLKGLAEDTNSRKLRAATALIAELKAQESEYADLGSAVP